MLSQQRSAFFFIVFFQSACFAEQVYQTSDTISDHQSIAQFVPNSESNFTIAHDGNFISKVQLGTLTLSVLTASAADTTWFPDVNCATCQSILGSNQNLVDFTQSPSYKMTDAAVQNITYASGSIMGYVSEDNLVIQDLYSPLVEANLSAYQFLAVISVQQLSSNTLKQGKADGVLALSPQTDNKANLVDLLYSQKLISKTQILLNNSAITFGYISQQPSTWTSLSSSYFWQVPLQGVYLNNYEIKIQGAQAVIDTTQQGLVMPQEDLKLILNSLKKDKLCQLATSESSEIKTGKSMRCLCDENTQFPTIYIQINGEKLAFKPEDYIVKQGSWCLALIEGQNVYGAGWWILGQKFLKNKPVILDHQKQRLGFVLSKTEVENVSFPLTFIQIMTYVVASLTALTILFVVVQLATKLDCLATESEVSLVNNSVPEVRRPVREPQPTDDQFNRQ